MARQMAVGIKGNKHPFDSDNSKDNHPVVKHFLGSSPSLRAK